MACVEKQKFDPAKDPYRCKCQRAVMSAYKELKKDCPESVAIDAATRIYGYHHPEDSKADQRLTVERWINEERFH